MTFARQPTRKEQEATELISRLKKLTSEPGDTPEFLPRSTAPASRIPSFVPESLRDALIQQARTGATRASIPKARSYQRPDGVAIQELWHSDGLTQIHAHNPTDGVATVHWPNEKKKLMSFMIAPHSNYTWIAPPGCEIQVGGGGGEYAAENDAGNTYTVTTGIEWEE